MTKQQKKPLKNYRNGVDRLINFFRRNPFDDEAIVKSPQYNVYDKQYPYREDWQTSFVLGRATTRESVTQHMIVLLFLSGCVAFGVFISKVLA